MNFDAMELGFVPGRETKDALCVVKKLQVEYKNEKKL